MHHGLVWIENASRKFLESKEGSRFNGKIYIKGDPKVTGGYSVEELKEMNLVGIYVTPSDAEFIED
tara:strand:+ start:536 stop:733 length:198 start_codon:yes stop_codon:yes gene_type:complete